MTDTTPSPAHPGGWPDPARPGVPLHPERDGWHWLSWHDGDPRAWEWDAETCPFGDGRAPGSWRYHDAQRYGASGVKTPHMLASNAWTYLAPCLTPTEVAAREAAAVAAERERCTECDAELIDIFNRLGRVTSELGLSEGATAGRIIEKFRDLVLIEREACASQSLPLTIPNLVDEWSPAEAFFEGTIHAVSAFRDAIRARDTP